MFDETTTEFYLVDTVWVFFTNNPEYIKIASDLFPLIGELRSDGVEYVLSSSKVCVLLKALEI